jgi:osmoprotectant transport system permease protein
VGIVLQALLVVIGFTISAGPARAAEDKPIVVGSKRFTESYVLGEIVAQTLVASGRPALHRQGPGQHRHPRAGARQRRGRRLSRIHRARSCASCSSARAIPGLDELNRWLAPRGLVAAVPLGFNNTYALAMSEARAKALGISRISDLASPAAGALKLGLSHEFLQRADGWPALRQAYGLAATPTGLDHGLAYDAVSAARST